MNAFGLISIFVVVSVLTGCSTSDRWVHEDAEGLVSETFFSTVKKNKTKKNWVMDHLGHPQSILDGPNGEQITTYHFTRTRYRSVSVLFVLRYTGSVHDVEYYHIMYCGDLVKKAWWDKFSEVDVDRLTRRSKCRAETASVKS